MKTLYWETQRMLNAWRNEARLREQRQDNELENGNPEDSAKQEDREPRSSDKLHVGLGKGSIGARK
jgi:hypothetical protein